MEDSLKLELDVVLKSFDLQEDLVLESGFVYVSQNQDLAVIIDYNIWVRSENIISYSEYTKHQNSLMSQYSSLFRFMVDDSNDLEKLKVELGILLSNDFDDNSLKSSGRNRELSEIDPTKAESFFESAFIETYGRSVLDCVTREYPIIDIYGSTRYVDYMLKTKNGFIAIEKNGETYHHPVITGKKQYYRQLVKQNSLVAYGIKLYRWSTSSMQFVDAFSEELKQFLGDKSLFLLAQKLQVTRPFALLQHQDDILNAISSKRAQGNKSFLVVLPTGTGKTEILIDDIAAQWKNGNRVLFLVPGKDLKAQMIERFRQRIGNTINNIDIEISDNKSADIIIQTYSWMSRYYEKFASNYFNYLAVDEAHHAVAPTLRKVVQHFEVDTLLGLTATDKRLDEQKLEDIFGKYSSDLSLQEALKLNLLAPIRAFRLKSNVDLSEIRFNGKDYYSTDLQKNVMVPSRDQLIVDTLLKYFVGTELGFKQGLIFCVSVQHAKSLAKLLTEHKISAKAASGSDNKSSSYIEDYQSGRIQFLTTCSLLNEGWDSPQTSIIVMARPTMSQVLYTQQLGRGTRKCSGKEALYVIDVVDNYGGVNTAFNTPWSAHAILSIANYKPWSNIMNNDNKNYSSEEVVLFGLYEEERRLEPINIFTFEKLYGDYLNEEQLARELFVSTDTLKKWVKSGKIRFDVEVPVGKKKIYFFNPVSIDDIISDLGLIKHDESTQYQDFFDFVEEGDYSMSYKIIMMLSMLDNIDKNGECSLDELLRTYISFYKNRLNNGLDVDKKNCPYSTLDMLDNNSKMKQSLLKNPFEKFERKRFMYHCKDLNRIAFSSALWQKIVNNDLNSLKEKYIKDLKVYYNNLGGISSEEILFFGITNN